MKVMEKNFDFNSVGKRMPYTTPQGLFGTIERNVMAATVNAAAAGKKRKTLRLRVALQSVAVAASIIVLLAFNFQAERFTPQPVNVEQAFANLSQDDQASLLEMYQDDVFLNDINQQ